MKCDLQGDKDRHLHSMLQERTRLIQQITDQADEEKRRINAYAKEIMANLQDTNIAATDQPTEQTLRHSTPLNNQGKAGQTQWTPENQSQTSHRTMSQPQYHATQNDDILQQPSRTRGQQWEASPPTAFMNAFNNGIKK
jgi:hypothetical protein